MLCISGLIQSFNTGASHAVGPVLTFLSAKCEVNIHWLQPLLHRLSQNHNLVVSPVLDNVLGKTGQYEATDHNVKGGK